MNRTKAWILAVGTSVVLVVGTTTMALVGHGGGEPHANAAPAAAPAGRPDQASGSTSPPATSPGSAARDGAAPVDGSVAPTLPSATASPEQVQQVVLGLLARLQQAPTGTDGQPKVVTPAEIEIQVRAELAKIGLHP